MAIEALKHSAEDLSTSREAIYWTENSPKSKLNNIKGLLEKSNNDQVKNLKDLLNQKEYVKFQKEIGCSTLDGKLGNNTLNDLKTYIETQALNTKQNHEINEEVTIAAEELQEEKQNILVYQSHSITNLPNYKVKNSKGEEVEKWGGETIRENDGEVEINIKKRSIEFTGIFVKNEQGSEIKFQSINKFYRKQTNDGIEIYSNGCKIPRLKINNDGTVVGISTQNGKNFDIKLDGAGTIFDTLKKELVNKCKDCETPTKEIDGSGGGFDLTGMQYRKGHIFIDNDGYGLYNNKTKKWEHINCLYNVYVKKDADDRLFIYSCGEKEPKIILGKDGKVKGRLLGNENEFSYGAKEDTGRRQTIWTKLNTIYSSFPHKDVEVTYDTKYTTYITKEEPKYVNAPLNMHRNENGEYVSERIVADGRGNAPRQSTSQETILSNIEWKYIDETFYNVEIFDINNYVFGSEQYLGKITDLHISSIAKKGKTLILNKGAIEITDKNGDLGFKYRDNRNNSVTFNSSTIGATGKAGTSNNQREYIYKKLDKKYFG